MASWQTGEQTITAKGTANRKIQKIYMHAHAVYTQTHACAHTHAH